jgi:hypothetical protein
MKKLLVVACLIFLSVSCAFAQRLQARFVTSAYAWERQDTIGTSSQHLFGYQTIQLSIAGEKLSSRTRESCESTTPISKCPTSLSSQM